MEMYLLKSAACLAILLVFYKVFLEKESFHNFKRFYLLGILLVSFAIPLITFIQYVEPQYVLGSFLNPIDEAIIYPAIQEVPVVQPFGWSKLLWSIYGLGVLFFGIRFLLNLSSIVKRIQSNPKTKRQSFINVLLNDLVIPHTFFNYIFLNKSKFEKQEIPEEVLLHEQTHAKQKHSIDILLVEILQIAFWFNPLIYFLKNTIKLNHEFLADQAVMNQGINPTTYQQLLLVFSSNATEPQLANAINYSSIKKRFKVMKTQTSQKTVWIKSFVLLPLLAFMVYGFSTTKEIEKEVAPLMEINPTEKHTVRSIDLKILEDGNYVVDGIKVTKNMLATAVNKLHRDITPEIRNNIMNIHVSSSKEISKKEVWFIYNSLLDYGFYRIVTPNQEVVKGKGNTPFKVSDSDEDVNQNLDKEIVIMVNNNKRILFNNRVTPLENFDRELSKSHSNLSKNEREIQVVSVIWYEKGTDKEFVDNLETKLRKHGVKSLLLEETEIPEFIQNRLKLGVSPVLSLKLNPLKLKLNGKDTSMDALNKDFNVLTNNKATEIFLDTKETITPQLLQKILKKIGPNATNFNLDNIGGGDFQIVITQKQMTEYNRLAKHYNSKLKKSKDITIQMKDVERLKYIFEFMSKQQRKDAEPFPDFPEPPPPPKTPNAPMNQKFTPDAKFNKSVNKINNLILKRNQILESSDINNPIVKDLDYRIKEQRSILNEYLKKLTKNEKASIRFLKDGEIEEVELPLPPPPPVPETLEIIEEEMPIAPPPPPIPENATPAQRAKYKAVIADYVKKYPKSVSKVKTSAGELIEVVEMPVDALPPPPPAKTGFKSINGKDYYFVKDEKGTRYFNRFGVQVDKKGKELNDGVQTKSSDVIPGQYVSKVYKDGKVMGEFDNTGAPPPPPPPPAPPTMEELAEKGAIFYIEGKKVTSEKAIKYANSSKGKNLNMSVQYINTNTPTVKLSNNPIGSSKKN